MNSPATYGELMAIARTSTARAGKSIATTPLGSPAAARALLAARAAVIAATRDQARALFGPARIDAVTSGNPQRNRPGRSTAVVRDERSRTFLAWTDHCDRLITAVPTTAPVVDAVSDAVVSDEHAATGQYRRAATAVRAATDLLATYRARSDMDLRLPPAGDAALFEPLRIAEALTGHHVYAPCRQAGMPAKDINKLLPLGATEEWARATRALALALPQTAPTLEAVAAAGVIRTDRPSTEWTDRITRLPARLRTLATTGPIGVDTMVRAAHAGLVSHYLRAAAGHAPEANPWFEVREQLRQWRSPITVDPIINADVTRLSALARDAHQHPDTPASLHLTRAALTTTGVVDDLAELANRLMPTVDRWHEAKPTHAYLQRMRTPPYIAWRPTEAPMVWPTKAPSTAPPSI